MDGNLSEMLSSVLSDPDAMKKLMGVAQNFMGSAESGEDKKSVAAEQNREEEKEQTEEVRSARRFPIDTASNNERIALIAALRPYLSPERKEIADSLIKMLKMMKLADISKLIKD